MRPHAPTAANVRRALLLGSLVLIAACDDEGGTDPALDGSVPGLDGALVDGQVPGQDGEVPGLDAGPVDVTEDSGLPSAQEATTGDPALDAVRGDYLLRFHNITRADNALFGQVTTESTTYGVMHVVAEGAALVGYEYLCHDQTVQTATNGSVSTTVAPGMWPNLSPVPRPLTLDTGAGTWSTPEASRRQGWRETAAVMPTDPATQSADLLDPDTDGRPGVATRIAGEGVIIEPFTAQIDCEYDIVSTTTSSYAGKLSAEGLPESAQISATGDAHALTATKRGGAYDCTVDDINDGAAATIDKDELGLSRVDTTWLATDGSCPSLPEFQAAFP